jgi:hypothetical protein
VKAHISLKATILELAAGPNGVRTDEVAGYSTKQASRSIERMVSVGLLHKVKSCGRWVRYYADKGVADLLNELERNRRELLQMRQKYDGLVAEWGTDDPSTNHPNFKHTVYPPSRMGEFVTNTHKDW